MRTGGLLSIARIFLADLIRSVGLALATACEAAAARIEPAREWPLRLWQRDHDDRSDQRDRLP